MTSPITPAASVRDRIERDARAILDAVNAFALANPRKCLTRTAWATEAIAHFGLVKPPVVTKIRASEMLRDQVLSGLGPLNPTTHTSRTQQNPIYIAEADPRRPTATSRQNTFKPQSGTLKGYLNMSKFVLREGALDALKLQSRHT